MSKKSFHRFNQNIDKEPAQVSTDVQVTTPKIEKPVFNPEIRIEESAPAPEIKPDTESLKELFGELSDLLAKDKQPLTEEPINTNPSSTGPVPPERNANANDPTPAVSLPVDPVAAPAAADDLEDDEEAPQPSPVQEAKLSDIRSVADEIAPPKPTPAPVVDSTASVVQSTTPVDAKPKKWFFKVNRNPKTNLIDSIEATSA